MPGQRVVAHGGRGDGVGAERIAADQEQPRLDGLGLRGPRALAGAAGFNAVDHGQVDGPRAEAIGRDPGDPILPHHRHVLADFLGHPGRHGDRAVMEHRLHDS